MEAYLSLLFSIFLIAIVIGNIWPQKMRIKDFMLLYVLMLCAALPIPLLTFKQYGLFAMLLVVCLYGLVMYPDTRSQNVCMGLCGCILAIILDNVFVALKPALPFALLGDEGAIMIGTMLLQGLLFYSVTFFCGKMIRRGLLNRKSLWQIPQVWYLIDVALLLFLITFFFYAGVRGSTISVAGQVYYNALFFAGYFFVATFLSLSLFSAYQEKIQTEAKQASFQALQDHTRELEGLYEGLRAFKHDYINILISLSGYIENGDMAELKDFFDKKILPTKDQFTQGDYKLEQLRHITILEIKSLLSAKMIHAHDMGIDVTIHIASTITDFFMDTVDLARILGIFLDNAVEAALQAVHPQVGLAIIQDSDTITIVIRNSLSDDDLPLHRLKQPGFTTKADHLGIGLTNAQKIISSYDNILWETTKQNGYFTQRLEIAREKG